METRMIRLLTQIGNILRGKTIRDRQTRTGYLFVLPCIMFFVVTFMWPAGYSLYLSFHKFSFTGPPVFEGLRAYQSVLHDGLFWSSMQRTLYLLLLTVPATLILSLALALAFTSLVGGATRSFFRAVYFLPVITSAVAVAFVWRWLYDGQNGLVNEFLRVFGMRGQNWLADPKLVLPSIAVMIIWSRLGFDMIIFIAGLQSIPDQYYEVAKIDGAGAWARFRHITLPLLNAQLVLVIIFEVINGLKVFDMPYIATQGGPANASRVAVFHIYDLAFTWNKLDQAVVAALFLFLLIMAATVLQWRLLRHPVEY
jgi:multiple sugar transport system permease protein